VVTRKMLDGPHAQILLDGGKISMIYLPKNPHHIIYFTEDLPNPWVWLAVGIVFAGVFVYAWKLLRRERQKI